MNPPSRAWRRGVRLANVACRTAHLAAFAVLFGGHVWGVEPERLRSGLWATIVTGVLLAALEVAGDPRWLVEARGAMVALKLAVLLLVPVFWAHRVLLLTIVVVVAGVGSHMPRWFRHARLVAAGSFLDRAGDESRDERAL